MRKTLGFKIAAACAAVLLSATACGGGSGSDRPSTDRIAKALNSGDSALGDVPDSVTKPVINCVAKVFHDSDLSDKTLKALVNGDKDYKGSDSEEKVIEKLEPKLKDCMTKNSK